MSASVPLFAREYGSENDNTPLVILHGFLGSSRNWQLAARDLAETRPVFALDLRNHGESPHATDQSFEGMAQDLFDWLHSNSISQPHVLGHSLGGKVVMRLACLQPELFEKVIIVDIAPKAYRPHIPELQAMGSLDLSTITRREEAEAQLLARLEDINLVKFLATNLKRESEGGFSWRVNLPVLIEHVQSIANSPLESNMTSEENALFILGGDSPYVGPQEKDLIRHHFPKSRMATIKNCGHNPHYDKRVEFVEVVKRFL